MALTQEQQRQVGIKIKDFFNTLPKEVVGVSYDKRAKTVNVQFVQTVEKPITGEDLFGDLVDILRSITKK